MMKKTITLIFIIFCIGIILLTIYNVDTTKADTVTLANTVISKWQSNGSPTSWSEGASGIYRTNGHEYRYVGANVDNWVSFNNDMYRIIGVFDSSTTGVSGNLVKLIRDKTLMYSAWGAFNDTTNYTTFSNYNNNWTKPANLNVLLNTYFFNSDATSQYGTCEDLLYYTIANTSYGNNYKTNDCSKIKRYSIKTQELRNYIQPASWYLKGYKTPEYSKSQFYSCERSDSSSISNCDKSNFYGDTTVTKASNLRIGLMYVSDYLYASGHYSSSDTTAASYYEGRYPSQNWLYNGFEWTITPVGTVGQTSFGVTRDGIINSFITVNALGVRPSFYLKSSVYVTGGNGSYSNPYTIACDNCGTN